jgi:hypothetical protein
MAQTLGIWIATGLTLIMLSFLYKDNPFFRFGEHLYLGISNAYTVWFLWDTIVKPDFIGRVFINLDPVAHPEWHPNYMYLVPGIVGIILLTRMIPSVSWMSRWSLAFIVGWGAGVTIGPELNSFLLAQIYSTIPWTNMQGLTAAPAAEYIPALINALILFACVLTVLVYFFFSVEHKGVIGGTAKIGIWVLMIAFGASFGSTVMARISLFIGRARFLVQDAEPRGHAFSIQLAIAIILILCSIYLTRRAEKKKVGEQPAAE